jgi:hypothetical protein
LGMKRVAANTFQNCWISYLLVRNFLAKNNSVLMPQPLLIHQIWLRVTFSYSQKWSNP